MNKISSISVGFDDTDHLAFFCSHEGCKKALKVTGIATNKVLMNTRNHWQEKCTWIYLQCPVHGDVGFRKFYWTDEGQEYMRPERN